MKKTGLYLMGGGAKGAFQAGVLKALHENYFKFVVVSGTSIGAINGYFYIHNSLEKLEKLYKEGFNEDFMNTVIEGTYIDNGLIKEEIDKIDGSVDNYIEAFYVNYMKIKDSKPKEEVTDILRISREEAVEAVLKSSRLPYNNPPMNFHEFIQFMNSHNLEEKFKKDLSLGVYDYIDLDGGFINNDIIGNIFSHDLDEIVVIGYRGNSIQYLEKIDSRLKVIRETFNIDEKDFPEIYYISSDIGFKVTDTYEFNKEFLKERFEEGYMKGLNFTGTYK